MTYEEFITLGGNKTVSQDYFNSNIDGYSELIDYYTFYRIDYTMTEQLEKADKCLVELINNSYATDVASGAFTAGIAAETVGQHKVEYSEISASERLNLVRDKEVIEYRIVKKYFALSGLMYRGV